MDWSLLHALNDFLFHHDGVEDPLLFYVNLSEALFIATLAIVFLAARGAALPPGAAPRLPPCSAPALASPSASDLRTRRPRPSLRRRPPRRPPLRGHAADPGFPSDHATAAFAIAVAILLRKRGWGIAALVLSDRALGRPGGARRPLSERRHRRRRSRGRLPPSPFGHRRCGGGSTGWLTPSAPPGIAWSSAGPAASPTCATSRPPFRRRRAAANRERKISI